MKKVPTSKGLPKGVQATSSTAGPNAVFAKRPGTVSGKAATKITPNASSKQVSI